SADAAGGDSGSDVAGGAGSDAAGGAGAGGANGAGAAGKAGVGGAGGTAGKNGVSTAAGGGDCSHPKAGETGVTDKEIRFAATVVKSGIAKDFLSDAQFGME